MAIQMVATSGNKRLRPNQAAALNARLPYLSTIVSQRQQKLQRGQDLEFRQKEFNQSERGFEQQRRQQKEVMQLEQKTQKMGAGVSAAKLGLGVAQSSASGGFGANKIGSMFGGKVGDALGGGAVGKGISDFSLGTGLASGLAGFGASRFGGDSKLKKIGLGVGAGALMGLMSGSGNAGSAFGGGFMGAIGSLF